MEELKYHYQYPHPCVTTDCVIFGFDGTKLNVLLIERGIDPFKGRWAFPGGFLKMDETALQGAKRELYEETGLKDAYIHQFHAFSGVDRDPRERVITIAYFALVRCVRPPMSCAVRFTLSPSASNCCQRSSR